MIWEQSNKEQDSVMNLINVFPGYSIHDTVDCSLTNSVFLSKLFLIHNPLLIYGSNFSN